MHHLQYDINVPLSLKREQQWFGSIIGQPIDEESLINPITPSGHSIESEAAEHIAPSPSMKPAQRIQIYNQQYWWRLINTLQESFPLVVRLFGFYDFNRTIAIPYLAKYPPNHWSLNFLGDRLPLWVEESYHAQDKSLVYNAVKIDWAFNNSFVFEQLPPLTALYLSHSQNKENLLTQTLYLQPHLHFIETKGNFFTFRNEFLTQSPDYWLENDFPQLNNSDNHYAVIFRDFNHDTGWKEITSEEYYLLHQFSKGTTIEKACEWLEQQEEKFSQIAMHNLQEWFQEWTHRGWLSLQAPQRKLSNLYAL